MKARLNVNNYPKLDFLINNFYEIVDYKRGRGVYGDRIILRRPKKAECVFGEKDKNYDFYYLDANDVLELPKTIELRIQNIEKFITNPESMNILCDFNDNTKISDWTFETTNVLNSAGLDFKLLNDLLIDRYKLLDSKFIENLQRHRIQQYTLASSQEYCLIDDSYASQQISKF